MELIKENMSLTEIKLKKSSVTYVDGDVIVPDVKPDILKILQVDAVSRVDEKEVLDGEIRLRGTVKYNILYIPDGEGERIKSIAADMEFSYTIDKIDTSGEIYPNIFTDVERVEFNLLNSRKLNIKTAVSVECLCFGKREVEIAKNLEDECTEAIYNRITARRMDVFDECDIHLNERIEIPAGISGISEILKMDLTVSDREIKAITGKAVLKGNLRVCVLYLDMEKNIHSVDAEIPFTEIAEIFDLEEDAECFVEYHLGDFGCEVAMDADGEARCVEFEASIGAVITSGALEEFELLSDCFCPGKPFRLISERVLCERVVSAKKCQHTIKDIVASDKNAPGIASVYNVLGRPTVTKHQVRDGVVILEGRLEVYVLYITDNSQIPINCLKKDIPVNISVENEVAKEGMDCDVKICLEHIAYNLNMVDEVEIRAILTADVSLFDKSEMLMISGVEPEEKDRECGIVIYFVKSGDTLWNIAKRYSVSIDSIKDLNGIEDKNLIKPGQRLIIPVC